MLPKKALEELHHQAPWTIHLGGDDLVNTFNVMDSPKGGMYYPAISTPHLFLESILRTHPTFYIQPLPNTIIIYMLPAAQQEQRMLQLMGSFLARNRCFKEHIKHKQFKMSMWQQITCGCQGSSSELKLEKPHEALGTHHTQTDKLVEHTSGSHDRGFEARIYRNQNCTFES